ncbi:aminotransferase [Scenedesmus sp. NREL 46B-D3]|nr:aminotransferase [Scenedesmus sp. NREL 46B-D3]
MLGRSIWRSTCQNARSFAAPGLSTRFGRFAAVRTACSASNTLSTAVMQRCLVHNGQVVPCEASAKEWLKSAPRGAYTTARTMRGDLVFMLSSHVQRLATSANLMMDADARAADHLSSEPPLSHSDTLRPLVAGCMRAAVQELSQRVQQQGSQPGEAKLTLLLTWGSSGQPDLWCHAEPLLPRPKPPVKLLIQGLPRVNAKAKDSEWVRQRQALEQQQPRDVNEVILMGPNGSLTEGLTSNFFVVSAAGEVVTANEGALNGTVREVVLQVCAERGIAVRLEAPLLSDMGSWQGAFITSTSRLLLPVCEIAYHEGQGQLQHKAWLQQHPLVQQLDAEVAAKVLSCSEPLLSTSP